MTTTERLAALYNCASRYEVAVIHTDGARFLIGYTSRNSRHGLLKVTQAKGQAIIDALHIADSDMVIWATRAADGFRIGPWSFRFTGRTERQAVMECELRSIAEQLTQRENWQGSPSHWRYQHCPATPRLRAVGRAVARIIARHGTRHISRFTALDYADLDKAAGCKVTRESGVSERRMCHSGYLGYIVRQYAQGTMRTCAATTCTPERGLAVREYLTAIADVEYWREMELLSGQRQQWKPGLTDETNYADDEAAA